MHEKASPRSCRSDRVSGVVKRSAEVTLGFPITPELVLTFLPKFVIHRANSFERAYV